MKRIKLLVAVLLTCLATSLSAFALAACSGSNSGKTDNVDTIEGVDNTGSADDENNSEEKEGESGNTSDTTNDTTKPTESDKDNSNQTPDNSSSAGQGGGSGDNTSNTTDSTDKTNTTDNTNGTTDSTVGNGSGQTSGGNEQQTVVETHNLTLVSAKSATCKVKGNIAYYICSNCNKWFSDENATTEIKNKSSVNIATLSHTPQVIEAVEATCTTTGLTEGSICSVCQTVLVEQAQISKTNHNYENGMCTFCSQIIITDGLEYKLSSEGKYYSVSGIGTVTDTDIFIPSEYNNLPVTTIENSAFKDCSNITSVTIPNSVIYICNSAFYGCSRLTSVTIGRGVTSIAKFAFYYCTALTEIKFNATACGDLSYNDNAFGYAGQSSDGINVIIGANVTKMPAYLFYSSPSSLNIKSIEFEEDSACKSIGNSIFYNCTNLITITIPSSVTSIGNCAFYNCSALTEIKYNAVACSDLSKDNLVFCNAGKDSSGIKVTIGEKVTRIPAYLFYPYSKTYSTSYSPKIKSVEFFDNSVCQSLGSCAFYNCISLISVEITSNVTTIENSAFYNCIALSKIKFDATACEDLSSVNEVFAYAGKSGDGINVIIGANVTKIPAYLFYSYYNGTSYTPKLVSVEFVEDSICQSIGSRAFYNCGSLNALYISSVEAWCNLIFDNYIDNPLYYAKNLYINNELVTNLVIPNSVTSIGNYAFFNCSNLINLTITNCVTSIGLSAFCDCSSLTTIEIPSSVTTIGRSAFYNCTALTEIKYKATACEDLGDSSEVFGNAGLDGDGINVLIGANVTKIPTNLFSRSNIISVKFEKESVCQSIGSYAFNNCSSLKSIIIPEGITSIGDYAFSYCSSLTEVAIPNSVTSIGDRAFYDCSSLNYNDYNDADYLGNDDNNYLVLIKAKSNDITSCEINQNTKIIYGSAFYDCSSLKSLIVGQGVIVIGRNAFRDCAALTEIKYNATACDDLSENNYVFYNAGQSGDGIKVTIGANVTKIPNYLFYPYSKDASCLPKITSVEFEDGSVCQSIGNYVFYNCIGLTTITIPNIVEAIGDYAFYNCTALTEIKFNATACDDLTSDNYVFYKAGQSGDGIKVIIGANVTKIPAYLFNSGSYSYSPKIISVEFEDGSVCQSIGNYAFHNCSSLTSLSIPNTVTSIGDSVFSGCISLNEIYINSIEAWCKIPFASGYANPLTYAKKLYLNNELVTNLVIPDSVTSIASYAFDNCSSLTSVTIGSGVTSIGDHAFDGCSGLISVTIGDGVSAIGKCAFYNCNSLVEVSILGGVTSIGSSAFSYCSSLTEVTIPNSVTSIGSHAFDNCSSLTNISIPNSVTTIGESTFSGCSGLTEITIPSGVTSIGSSAFSGCSSLTSLTIPSGVTSIGSSAFSGCSSLTSLTIPSGVTSIGMSAFSGCSSLTEVTIPNNVTSIGEYAFSDCSSLVSVTIANSVTSIGYRAFNDCINLSTVYYGGTTEDWDVITVGSNNSYLTEATRYYYSEEEPTEEGNYWHYDSDGVTPVVWTKA